MAPLPANDSPHRERWALALHQLLKQFIRLDAETREWSSFQEDQKGAEEQKDGARRHLWSISVCDTALTAPVLTLALIVRSTSEPAADVAATEI